MIRVPAADLRRLMDAALARRGVPAAHRAHVIDALVGTSLRGVDSHGVALFPTYARELDGGRARAAPDVRVVHRRGAAATIDADGALGAVASRVAGDLAVSLAAEAGVGAVAVRGSNHFGAAGAHALHVAETGLVGVAISNADALVVPHGGSRPMFGTNPIAVAMRGVDGELFLADFATSQGSFLQSMGAWRRGEPVRAGVLADARGLDVAGRPGAEAVSLFPLGGHKGQALAMIVTLLTAVLAGGPLDHTLGHLLDEPFDAPREICHLVLALDPGAFGNADRARRQLSELLAAVRSSPATEAPVLVPGDREREAARVREEAGVPVPDALWAELQRLGSG